MIGTEPPRVTAGELYNQLRLHGGLPVGCDAFRAQLHQLLVEHGLCTVDHGGE